MVKRMNATHVVWGKMDAAEARELAVQHLNGRKLLDGWVILDDRMREPPNVFERIVSPRKRWRLQSDAGT